jgi:ribosomal protein L37AE/L43A
MAGYSKENERQNKALKSILKGQTPEERVMVGYEGKKDNTPGDKIDRLSEIMKEARMPWFCPKCDKVMKKRLDNKMWMYYGHCFDCQVDDENKKRIEGKFDEWAEEKVKNNKIVWIKEQRESIEEFKKQKSPSFLNAINPNGYSVEKEKWATDFIKIQEQADEALEYLDKLEESLT